MSPIPDPHAPPASLDVTAARLAARLYRSAVARGVPHQDAWDEAVATFGGHHPSWPLPLVEDEAVRTVGALLARDAAADALSRATPRKPPLDVLLDLATPSTPETMRAAMRVGEMGFGATSMFRGAWKVPARMRPVATPLPLSRLVAPPPAPAA